jgi:arylsulfatase A-like enzyme
MYSILTGVYPEKHDIPANLFFDVALDRCVSAPRDVRVPTLADLMKQRGIKTAAVGFSMLQGRIDKYVPAQDHHARHTLEVIDRDDPGLLLIYFGNPDQMGHAFGPQSSHVRRAVEETDAQIGALVSGLESRGLLSSTLLVVTSDHGMSAVDPLKLLNLQVAQALTQTGVKWQLLASGPPESDTEVVWTRTSRLCLLTLRKPLVAERETELLRNLRAIPGIEDVWGTDELRRRHASGRLRDYVLVPKPRYHFGSILDRGGHGSKDEMEVPLIYSGPGVKRNDRLDVARIVDIVPTVLRLMGGE